MTIATIPYTFTTHHKTASNIESCSRLFQGKTASKTCLKCHAGFCCTDRSGTRRPLGSLVQSSQLPVDLPTKDVNIDLPQGDPKMRRFIPKKWDNYGTLEYCKVCPKTCDALLGSTKKDGTIFSESWVLSPFRWWTTSLRAPISPCGWENHSPHSKDHTLPPLDTPKCPSCIPIMTWL